MKTLLKGLIVVLFVMASNSVVLAGDIAVPDEALPPEVQKLIGVKVPPKVAGQRTGSIPNFESTGAYMLNSRVAIGNAKGDLAVAEGVVGGSWPVFVVSVIYDDRSEIILDVRLLPSELVVWRYENGKIVAAGRHGYIFSPFCRYTESDGSPIFDGRIVFGLEDINVEINGYSTLIKRAWEVDVQTGHIQAIPTKGVICAILGE